MHERLVFELLGIRERFSNSTTRKALDAYQDHRPQPQGKQDRAPMHKAPLRCAPTPAQLSHGSIPYRKGQVLMPIAGVFCSMSQMLWSMKVTGRVVRIGEANYTPGSMAGASSHTAFAVGRST